MRRPGSSVGQQELLLRSKRVLLERHAQERKREKKSKSGTRKKRQAQCERTFRMFAVFVRASAPTIAMNARHFPVVVGILTGK